MAYNACQLLDDFVPLNKKSLFELIEIKEKKLLHLQKIFNN